MQCGADLIRLGGEKMVVRRLDDLVISTGIYDAGRQEMSFARVIAVFAPPRCCATTRDGADRRLTGSWPAGSV